MIIGLYVLYLRYCFKNKKSKENNGAVNNHMILADIKLSPSDTEYQH